MNNIENTLKKMGLVIEKLAQKIDEMDKRLEKIEKNAGEGEKKFSSQDLKMNPQMQQPQTNQANSTSKSSLGGFGSSFLGSMAGAMAGMGLYNMLFNNSVTPAEFGHELGMNEEEINEAIENNFDDIDERLSEIDSKLDDIDSKLNTTNDGEVMNSDYYENYEEDESDSDFESGFDDFDDI